MKYLLFHHNLNLTPNITISCDLGMGTRKIIWAIPKTSTTSRHPRQGSNSCDAFDYHAKSHFSHQIILTSGNHFKKNSFTYSSIAGTINKTEPRKKHNHYQEKLETLTDLHLCTHFSISHPLKFIHTILVIRTLQRSSLASSAKSIDVIREEEVKPPILERSSKR